MSQIKGKPTVMMGASMSTTSDEMRKEALESEDDDLDSGCGDTEVTTSEVEDVQESSLRLPQRDETQRDETPVVKISQIENVTIPHEPEEINTTSKTAVDANDHSHEESESELKDDYVFINTAEDIENDTQSSEDTTPKTEASTDEAPKESPIGAEDAEQEDTTDATLDEVTEKLKDFKMSYVEMDCVARTMHWDAFVMCAKKKMFYSHKINKKYHTSLPKTKGYVWFRALSHDNTNEKHDWFGNVRCSFNLVEVLKNDPKINLFYVDRAYFGYSAASRILLTYKKKHPKYKKIELNKLKFGDPMFYRDDKLYFMEKYISKDRSWWGNHQMEFVVDTSTIGPQKLFKICDKSAVNHSGANRINKNGRFIERQCLIFNSGKKKECPMNWTQEECEEKLASLRKANML